ncbi:MAG: DUF2309 domain-containing protein [Nitrospiraceae bacterium]
MMAGTRMFSDAERMEVRSYVQLAGEAIAQYWPMRTFIHHNPLHGLEELPFDQAVKRGEQLFGGRGYLPNAAYRRYFEEGRIRIEDLSEVLSPIATATRVDFGGRELSHLEVLRLSMIHGLGELAADPSGSFPHGEQQVNRLAVWMKGSLGPGVGLLPEPSVQWESIEILSKETLSTWCDQTLGTALVATINDQMIKWCSLFLDEGEASWVMPCREQTFYRVWKALARYDAALRLLGIKEAGAKIVALDDRPEDALLRHLDVMKVPKPSWETYLALHLAALPGWTGYIKWRSGEPDHPWQVRYPIDLVKYLAVRLFYERELVALACRDRLVLDGQLEAIRGDVDRAPYAYWLRRELTGGKLPRPVAEAAQTLVRGWKQKSAGERNEAAKKLCDEAVEQRGDKRIKRAARQLLGLATAAGLMPESLIETAPADALAVMNWLEGFPASQQGRRWLEALESSHRRRVVEQLADTFEQVRQGGDQTEPLRPLAQMVFCIDVRSEVLRRHLENLGDYETLGLAGFFGIPLKYQGFGADHSVTHCPVLLKPRNQIREIPRSYHGQTAERHRFGSRLAKVGHTLLHDLKENVITPYVMVEALGWFFGLPLFARTLCPLWYQRIRQAVRRLFLPPLATTLTIDKLTREEAMEMVAAEQRASIRKILRAEFVLRGSTVTPALIETIRLRVLEETDAKGGLDVAKSLGIEPADAAALYERLRNRLDLTPRGMSSRLHRITHHGFSVVEQTYGVEAALRLMGLTSGFARLVMLCAHGSTSDNNPYESALDCGACGGNNGLPNARAFAAMANRQAVRDMLRTRGINIPNDTHFTAAMHDTTCDDVQIVDLEDVPATHRKDLTRLIADLKEAGAQAALERGVALRGGPLRNGATARTTAARRSTDWAQVRPEWGLSKNSLMVVGRRELTRPLNLKGRAFLHSYDHRQDESGKLLETIMTAPLVVAQWINMEHYFSTVDNEVYGSGSKVYHNVVGRVGVMSGAGSDLRIGLPAQTVMNGPVPYHEPMRLLTVIEAPVKRVQEVISKHQHLEHLFDQGWVSLLVLDPAAGRFYCYELMAGWEEIRRSRPSEEIDPSNAGLMAGRDY